MPELHVVAHYQETIASSDPRCRDIVEYRDRFGKLVLTVYLDTKINWAVHSHRNEDGTIERSPYAFGGPGGPVFDVDKCKCGKTCVSCAANPPVIETTFGPMCGDCVANGQGVDGELSDDNVAAAEAAYRDHVCEVTS